MATQNPIEQEGTYPLPEAQLDRFLMHVRIGYPGAGAERRYSNWRARQAAARHEHVNRRPAADPGADLHRTAQVLDLHMSPAVKNISCNWCWRTRESRAPTAMNSARWVGYGASPRGTIALDRCARAHAWLAGRDYVSPEDIQAVAFDTLRHRVLLSFEAEAEGIDLPIQFICRTAAARTADLNMPPWKTFSGTVAGVRSTATDRPPRGSTSPPTN